MLLQTCQSIHHFSNTEKYFMLSYSCSSFTLPRTALSVLLLPSEILPNSISFIKDSVIFWSRIKKHPKLHKITWVVGACGNLNLFFEGGMFSLYGQWESCKWSFFFFWLPGISFVINLKNMQSVIWFVLLVSFLRFYLGIFSQFYYVIIYVNVLISFFRYFIKHHKMVYSIYNLI